MSELPGVVDNVQDLRVLVVDDQVNMRRTVKNMLRMMGFKYFNEADDGDAALTIINKESLDLVVCDWNMPRMKGVQVLREVRSNKRFDDIAFLMLTGEVEEDKVAEVIEADVDGYLIKPFEIKTFEEKLIGILTKRRAPSALDVQFKQSEESREAGDFPEAHRALDRAAKIRPRSPMLYYQRGLVFEAEGKPTEAEKCFHLSKQLGPLFIRVHDKLAHISQARGRSAEVCNILSEAVKISPNNINRQMRLGRALLAEKRYKEARKAFRKVISLDNDNQNRKLAIGKIFVTHNMIEDAVKLYRDFLKVHPGNIDVYNRLGILLRRHGRLEEAADTYREAIQAVPGDPNLLFNLARVLHEMGDKKEASSILHKALNIDPDFAEARALLSRLSTNR